jgi:hypothetical protein
MSKYWGSLVLKLGYRWEGSISVKGLYVFCTGNGGDSETYNYWHWVRDCATWSPYISKGGGGVEVWFLCHLKIIFRIIKTSVFFSHSSKTVKILPSRFQADFYFFLLIHYPFPFILCIFHIFMAYFSDKISNKQGRIKRRTCRTVDSHPQIKIKNKSWFCGHIYIKPFGDLSFIWNRPLKPANG